MCDDIILILQRLWSLFGISACPTEQHLPMEQNNIRNQGRRKVSDFGGAKSLRGIYHFHEVRIE